MRGLPLGAGAAAGAATGAADGAAAEAEARQTDVLVLRGHRGPVYAAAFSRDDNFVLSGSQDGDARLWGLQQRSCLVCYRAHASPVWHVSFAPLGSDFAPAGPAHTLRVSTAAPLQPLRLRALQHGRCISPQLTGRRRLRG